MIVYQHKGDETRNMGIKGVVKEHRRYDAAIYWL